MRLLTWNLRHGGGRRLPALVAALVRHDADVLVLCEYRARTGPALRAALARHGYGHATATVPPAGRNGVLIAARLPLGGERPVSRAVAEPYRMLHVVARATPEPVHVVGAYLPNLRRKVPYWEALLRAARRLRRGPAALLGDFNTTRHYLDECGALCGEAAYMDRIERAGLSDVWRARHPDRREYSWFSTRGNGFRLDHAFCSPALARHVTAVAYSHAERAAGLSDHALLYLDLEFPTSPRRTPAALAG